MKQQNNELEQKIIQVEAGIELECYRAESRVRKQWEAREERLVQQLVELQHQVKVLEVDRVLPVSTLKTEQVEANQPISGNASVINCSRTTLASPRMEHLSLSTGTQPMRKCNGKIQYKHILVILNLYIKLLSHLYLSIVVQNHRYQQEDHPVYIH